RTNGASDTDADVFDVQNPESGFTERFSDGQLIHLFVVALLQVDDLALAGAADQDHGPAVGRGVRQRNQAVQEARRGHGQADARLLRQVTGDGGRVTGVCLVAERDDADAFSLRHTREVGDRNTGQTVNRVDVVQLQGIDEQLKAISL